MDTRNSPSPPLHGWASQLLGVSWCEISLPMVVQAMETDSNVSSGESRDQNPSRLQRLQNEAKSGIQGK